MQLGDEVPCGLCGPLPPVTAVLYYRWLAAGLYDKTISQGVGGHRVYVGIRHPLQLASFVGPSRSFHQISKLVLGTYSDQHYLVK